MKMSTSTLLVIAITIISIYSVHAGIRCENDIISEGDTSSEVSMKLSRCGEVLDKEDVREKIIVETDKKHNGGKIKKEKVLKIWYIRVKERGGMYCYPLTFEEGRLKSIGNWHECN